MIKRKTIIILDGTNKPDYERICQILDAEIPHTPEWQLHHEPLLNRVTAIKIDSVTE